MLSAEELANVPPLLVGLAWFGFVVGGFICLFNFYLPVRFYYRRWKGIPPDRTDTISGISLFGSLIVFLMLRTLGSIPAAMVIGVILIAIDVGGAHWIPLSFAIQFVRFLRKKLGGA